MTKKNIFTEDIRYGIYDRPGVAKEDPSDPSLESETTVPDEVPLSPSQHMSNQLSVQRPPIEDEDYVPGSIEDLSRAASAIAQLTPNDSIEYFYRQLHKLLDNATDRAAEKQNKALEEEEEEPGITVKEGTIRMFLRKTLKRVLLEAPSGYDYDDEKPLYGYDEEEDGLSIRDSLSNNDMAEFEDDMTQSSDFEKNSDTSNSSTDDGDYSLEQIAAEFGYSGAPGIRQEIERLTNRLTYFAAKVKKEDLDALIKYTVGEYIDTLDESGLVDSEDIEDLHSAPQIVKDLDSFRYFFVSAFVMPSYKKVVKDATKKVKTEISQLGIPKELHQTIFNQVTGATARKPQVIQKKLVKLSKDGKLAQNEIKPMLNKISNSRAALVAASDYSDDFVQNALDKWQSSSKGERVKALKQAMEQTLDNA